MKNWVLAAGFLAAVVTGPPGVRAADLDDGPPPYKRGAYEDPRYADIYRIPARPPPPYVAPPPRGPVYRQYDEEYDPPRRYAYGDARSYCVPRHEVRHRLHRAGWHDFHAAELRGEIATFHARRPSGRLFVLAVDRRSGEIVSVRPLEPRYHGPYAYYGPRPYGGPGPWGSRRWERPYY